MRRVRLTKLEATGNDFLVFADLDDECRPTPDEVRALCNRATGVGADGVIRVLAGRDGADLTMELTNADGGRAEMSGNGMRCLAALALRDGLVQGPSGPLSGEQGPSGPLSGEQGPCGPLSGEQGPCFMVATDAGIRTVEWAGDGLAGSARVDMGAVTFDPAEIPVIADSALGLKAEVDGVVYEGDAAGMGNPHFVLFVDDPLSVPVERHGPRLEHDTRFPHRVNVEFVHVDNPETLRMRVWERGVGETRSCGTGACAAAAAARQRDLVGPVVSVEVPGGTLVVEMDGTIWLGGPVSVVGEVEVSLGGEQTP